MAIEFWSEKIVLVSLPSEPFCGDEIDIVIDLLKDRRGCDVVVDFSGVEVVSSSTLAKLLKLRRLLMEQETSMLISDLSEKTEEIFKVTGLDNVFHFVKNHFLGLTCLQL